MNEDTSIRLRRALQKALREGADRICVQGVDMPVKVAAFVCTHCGTRLKVHTAGLKAPHRFEAMKAAHDAACFGRLEG